MNYRIKYHELVVSEDIPKLDSQIKQRIKKAIETKLQDRPELFAKPLRKSLRGYRALRVGDYRVVFRLQNSEVRILIIAYRSRVYQSTRV